MDLLEAGAGLKSIVQKYLLPNSPIKKITLRDHSKNMILKHVEEDGSPIRAMIAIAMEGLRLAQYEVFFTIKVIRLFFNLDGAFLFNP